MTTLYQTGCKLMHGVHMLAMVIYWVLGAALGLTLINFLLNELHLVQLLPVQSLLGDALGILWNILSILAGVVLAALVIVFEFKCDAEICGKRQQEDH